MKKVTIPSSCRGENLYRHLLSKGLMTNAPCGGQGKCGKCRVKVVKGSFLLENGSFYSPDCDGFILACKAVCSGFDSEIELEDTGTCVTSDFISGEDKVGEYAFALDIGTTTLCLALCKVKSGKVLATSSSLNPQTAFGADVISRINACDENLGLLQKAVLDEVLRLYNAIRQRFFDAAECDLYVSGNTTMLHLFCGISPSGIGKYPFTPSFTGAIELCGDDLSLPFHKICVLPSASAFIGSDVVCGVAKCEMTDFNSPTLLVDLGTNGEMALCTGKKNGGRIFTSSTAAGPCFEGAGISCGTGGVIGAISHVEIISRVQKLIGFSTVGDGNPNGLCGSGLIDLIAVLKKLCVIDKHGNMDGDYIISGLWKKASGELMKTVGVNTQITLTPSDVRQFQLAKSAIRSGIEAICKDSGVEKSDIDRVFLAGGLGFFLNVENSVCTGLVPKEFEKKTIPVGNTSLDGCVLCAAKRLPVSALSGLACRCENIDLEESRVFRSEFMKNMDI